MTRPVHRVIRMVSSGVAAALAFSVVVVSKDSPLADGGPEKESAVQKGSLRAQGLETVISWLDHLPPLRVEHEGRRLHRLLQGLHDLVADGRLHLSGPRAAAVNIESRRVH